MKNTKTAEAALSILKEGNKKYISSDVPSGDISRAIRERTAEAGQSPHTVVITCSDSRVIPECIFSAGIGELFVIRVAGNVIDRHALGSIEYAADHLGSRLVVVLGHTHCGAVGAAMHHEAGGFVKSITDEIQSAIGGETDELRACEKNVLNSVSVIESALSDAVGDFTVVAAIYDIKSGEVTFL